MKTNGKRPGFRDSEPERGDLLYSPAEVAKVLRCSEWWVKEQARRRRIPFSWIGGGYRFTQEQVDEIPRIFEILPTTDEGQSSPPRRRPRADSAATAPILTAKPPRRSRGNESSAA